MKTAEQLFELESEVVSLEIQRLEEEFTLKGRESALLTSEESRIDGKNAEIRAAQLWMLTQPERVLVMDLEAKVMKRKAELNQAKALHKSLLAIATLLANDPLQ